MLSFMEFLATSLQHVISVVTAFFRPDRHTDVQYVAIPQSRRRIDLGLITSANSLTNSFINSLISSKFSQGETPIHGLLEFFSKPIERNGWDESQSSLLLNATIFSSY